MAKNKVEIDVKVDDKGSTKKVGVGAKKAGKDFDNLSNSAHSTDRRLKGASQQSSNTTKNFSKMAQGISGGLVPAYATLASSLFAVSAAFQFLKSAGDLRTLQQGQVAYASATGIGMRTLTKSIQDAAGGMLTFADAAQAASIGVASGLSVNQLERMGKAAKDVSVVLGRDVTDSFNRLVKGATKAEPELLDELGIILRLEDAADLYGRKIGKAGKDLTTFEKQQAVTNFVLEEAERKYGGILDIIEVTPNSFAQLGKAFDDITNKIKSFVEKALSPVAKVLTEVPELAIAAFGLFGASILKTIVPSLNTFGDTAKANFATAKEEAGRSISQLKAYNNALKAGRGQTEVGAALGASAGAGVSDTLMKAQAQSGKKFKGVYKKAMTDVTKLNKKELQKILNDHKNNTGQIKLLSKKQRTALIRDIKDVELASKIQSGKLSTDAKIATNAAGIAYKKFALTARAALAGVQVGVSMLGRAMGALMGAFGWISLIVTGVMVIKDMLTTEKKLSDEQQALTEKVSSLSNEFKFLNKVMGEHNEKGFTASETLITLGNAASSVAGEDLKLLTKNLEDYYKTAEKLAKGGRGSGRSRRKKRSMDDVMSSDKGFSEEQVEAKNYFNTLLKGLDAVKNQSVLGSKVFQEYQAALKEGTDPERIQKASEAFTTFTKGVEVAKKAAVENQKAFKDSMSALFPESKEDTIFAQLTAEAEELRKIEADTSKLGKHEQDRLNLINKQLPLIKSIADAKHDDLIATQKINLAFMAASRGATPLQKERLNLEKQLLTIDQKINAAIRDRSNINTVVTDELTKQLEKDKQALEVNKNKLAELHLQKQAIQDQLNLQTQLNQAFKDGFEGATTKGIGDLIKGDESSFSDVALESVKGGLEASADVLAKDMSRKVTGFLFGDKAIKETMSQEDILRDVYDAGSKALKVTMVGSPGAGGSTRSEKSDEKPKIEKPPTTTSRPTPDFMNIGAGKPTFDNSQYVKGAGGMMVHKDSIFGPGGLDFTKKPDTVTPKITGKGDAVVGGMANVTAEQLSGSGLSLTDYMNKFNETGVRPGEEGGEGATLPGGDTFISKLDTFFTDAANHPEGLVGKLKDTFKEKLLGENGFLKKLGNTFKEKGKSLLDGLGGFLGKMKNNLGDILGGLKDSLGGLLQGLGGALSGMGGGIMSFFGFRSGGYTSVMKARNGMMPKYNTGGIARGRDAGYPAMLHGNEAVVPLPDGNKIPVEMKGAGATITNNITVNVSKEGNATQTSNTTTGADEDQDNSKFANILAQAVQEEIVKQQRPGGLLSQYGVG